MKRLIWIAVLGALTLANALHLRAQTVTQGNLNTNPIPTGNPEHNHDKAVTLFFEVLDGDRVVGTTTLGPLGVEDKGRAKDGSTKLVLPIEALKNDPPMKLRITMAAKDY